MHLTDILETANEQKSIPVISYDTSDPKYGSM